MTITFVPARRERASILAAFAGASGSGKTFSALRFARGLVGPEGKIAFADSEARRALHYAGTFDFDHVDLQPPFRPALFLEAVDAAERGGYGALIFDSFSHEYDGEGGIVDWAGEQEAAGVKSPGNWAQPKAAHKRLMQRLLQARLHLIFCLRADEKLAIKQVVDERTGRTKAVVENIGFQPIAEKRFMYEMTASFLFYPEQPGIPHPTKLQEQHKAFFPAGKPVTEETGERMAAWANGGVEPAARQAASPETFWSRPTLAITPNGGGWQKWQGRISNAIAAAPDLDALMRLDADNAEHLAALAAEIPRSAEALRDAIRARAEALSGSAGDE